MTFYRFCRNFALTNPKDKIVNHKPLTTTKQQIMEDNKPETEAKAEPRTIWAYDILVCDNNIELSEELNSRGRRGWEAYAVWRKENPSGVGFKTIVYLKRPKTSRK